MCISSISKKRILCLIHVVEFILSKGLIDSGYLSEKRREALNLNSDDTLTLAEEDEEEDPYRWVILFSGFLAQAISMCTLSSW